MKKTYFIIVLIIILILCIGCEEAVNKQHVLQQDKDINNDTKPDMIPYLKEGIDNNRIVNMKEKDVLHEEFSKLLYNYTSFNDQVDMDKLVSKRNVITLSISLDEAKYDIDFLFKLLKYSYGGYEYFGGDNSFLNAKNNIIKELESLESEITTKEFNKIIYENLNFIHDGHFHIGDYRFFSHYNYYVNEEYSFLKDEDGYYTTIDNKKHRLMKVNGENPEDYLRLSLDKEGNIVYNLGKLEQVKFGLFDLDIELKYGKKQINKKVKLNRFRTKSLDNIGYSLIEKDEVKIIENRRMRYLSEDEDDLKRFMDEAKDLKDEKVIILDIRSNGGGSDYYPMNWIKNYTGYEPIFTKIGSKIYTDTVIKLLDNRIPDIKDSERKKNVKENRNYIVNRDYFPGWTDIYSDDYKGIDNDNLVIVITDSNIASSGESFVNYLRQLKNVIFIGENTSGTMIMGDNYNSYLPNSKLIVRAGIGLYLELDLSSTEEKGYLPDLWVNPNDAVDRVLKFIKNYKLKENPNIFE